MSSTTSLGLLPAKELVHITNWLSGVDDARLFECGNSALNTAMAQGGVVRFVVLCEPPVRPTFPTLVARFRALEYFSLVCTYSVSIANFNLSLLAPCLKSLKLDFFSQSNLLRCSPEDLQIMDLWRMFPLLECVDLSTPLYWSSASEVIPRLENLRKLCLNEMSSRDLVRLPRSLTSLSIEMVEEYQDDWSSDPHFPPKLTTLKVKKMQNAKLLRWLPSSLINLSLHPSDQLSYYANTEPTALADAIHEFKLWWSKRPDSLTKLTIPSYGVSVDHLTQLPKTLTCLRLLDGGDIVAQLTKETKLLSAPSLTRLELPVSSPSLITRLLPILPIELHRISEWITSSVQTEDQLKLLPKKLEMVRHMNLRHGWARHLPKALKSLHFTWESPVDFMDRHDSTAAEEFSVREEKRRKLQDERFPATLRSITLDSSQYMQSSLCRALTRSGFTALESLNLNVVGETSLQRLLSSLAQCPVTNLRIGASLRIGHTLADANMFGRLHSLETLHLSVNSFSLKPRGVGVGEPENEDDLDTMTTSRDDCEESEKDKEPAESLIERSVFLGLPSSLTSVSINAYPMPVRTLSLLSRLTRCRTLVLAGIVGDVENQHVAELPKSLTSLKLGPGRLDSSSLALSSDGGWQSLPPYLTSLCLPAPMTEVVLDDGGVPKAPACLSFLVDLSFDSRATPAVSPRPMTLLASIASNATNTLTTSSSVSSSAAAPSSSSKDFFSLAVPSTSRGTASSPSTSSPRHKFRGKQSIFESDEPPVVPSSSSEHGIAAGEEDESD